MANTLIEANKAYRKDYPVEASRCLSQIVQHFIDEGGNFRRAATYQEQLAEVYAEQRDSANARQAYALAAKWYEGDNATMTANKLSVKSAEYAALDGDYLDAINRFEHAADLCLSKESMKFSIPKYILQAGYCRLALDIVGAMRALQGYRQMGSVSISPEFRYLEGLMEAVERGDIKAFTDRAFAWYGDQNVREKLVRVQSSWDKTMLDR